MIRLTPIQKDDTKKTIDKLLWRKQSVRSLYADGLSRIGNDLLNCGCNVRVIVCKKNPTHMPARPVVIHCGLPFCEDCANRESARKYHCYLPVFESLLDRNPKFPDNFLFKIVLTTPHNLIDLDNSSFAVKQLWINAFLSVYFFWYFHERGELSKAEIRSGRCNLRQHGIGALSNCEFGERGRKLHWHLMMYAPFMWKEDISAVWRDVTGDTCKIVDVSGIYVKGNDKDDGGGILGALKEAVKYSTKILTLSPSEVPHLYRVLKGNRRFRAFGIFYNHELLDNKEKKHTCDQCQSEFDLITPGTYVRLCESRNIPVSDDVANAVELGIALFLTREHEISSGRITEFKRRARDSLDDGGQYV